MKYFRPATLDEALKSLTCENVRLLAGGTDIIPGLRQNSARFRDIKTLCDISSIDELNRISDEENLIRIGSTVTMTQMTESELINKFFPLLSLAASQVGSVQIRNRATLAGNFINNAPCADSVPPLLVYDAMISIRSINEIRLMPLQEFLVSAYHTRLDKREIVTEIILPKNKHDIKGEFYKLGRRRGVSISRISFAVTAFQIDHMFDQIKIACGAVTPVGMRLTDLENYARCKKIDREFLKELAVGFGKAIVEKAGIRWSAPYKIPAAQQMFYQCLLRLTGCS